MPTKSSLPFLAPLFALVVFQLWLALTLNVNYLDSYETFLNAKMIAGASTFYFPFRQVVPSLALTPFFWLERVIGQEHLALRLSYFFSVAVFVALMVGVHRLASLWMTAKEALAATLLFSTTPLIIHYIPLSKNDLLGLCFLTWAFFLFWQDVRRTSLLSSRFCAALFVLAIGSRYNYGPFLVLLFTAVGATLAVRDRETFTFFWKHSLRVGAAATALAALVLLLSGNIGFIDDIWRLFRENQAESNWEFATNYTFLFLLFPRELLALALWGAYAFISERKGTPSVFLLLWGFVYFYFHTYFLAGREARFLFPVLIPASFLAVKGISALSTKLPTRFAKIPFVLLLIGCWIRVFGECHRMTDSFYRTPFDRKVSETVETLSDGKDVYWYGTSVGRHPRYYLFSKQDDYAYIYHYHPTVLLYYLNRNIQQFTEGQIEPRRKKDGYWLPGVGTRVKDGDVIVINPSPENHMTKIASEGLTPVIVQRVRVQPFRSKGVYYENGEYEVYRRNPSGKMESLGVRLLRENRIDSIAPDTNFFLLDFDAVAIFL